ncbi:magnesium transporter, partial [bacterium]|nr:magnesium transporter [bacterium]
LLGGVFVSGGVIRHFQTTLNSFLPLIFFVPVIMAMGGNVGIQSSTIIIRSLATGDIELGRAKRIILKEIGVGLVMGIVCGLLAGAAAPLFKMGGVGLGIIVGGSMFVALTVATSIGTFFPILLKRLDVDPAVAAGPFVTMTTDFTGLLIYLGLATSLIGFLK